MHLLQDAEEATPAADNGRQKTEDTVTGDILTGNDAICPRLRNVAGSRAKRLQAIISWCMFVTLNWQISNAISDSALTTLLKFICEIMVVFSMPNYAAVIRRVLPTSPQMLWKWLGVNRDDFQRFICCGKCYALYDSVEEFQYKNNCGELRIRRCTSVSRDGKKICNNQCLQEVKQHDGRIDYIPLFTYCYKPLSESLEALLMRPGFEDSCLKWKERQVPSNMFADIYDGAIWKEHVGPNKLLDNDNNLALSMNIDWFCPTQRRRHISLGAIYLVVLNLPRRERYKVTNVILLGIIPNLPKEPHTVESFLKPLVDELKAFWNHGIVLKSNKFPEGKRVRVALLSLSADLPAIKKLLGHLSHSANLGCSKCLKPFGGKDTRDVGGNFDRENWVPRTHAQHIEAMNEINAQSRESKKVEIEKKKGVRYTVLLELEYFRPVDHMSIDAMHNLYMGIAKRTWTHYVDHNMLTEKDLNEIDDRLLRFRVGSDEERAATYISSNYNYWTAEQWMSFVTVSSAYCLHGLLEDKHMKIWESFVLACRALTKPCLSLEDVGFADSKMLEFCKEAKKEYGKEFISPNFHYALHYRETIPAHGPVYATWCFAFERMNLRISDIPTNKRNLEIQYMRRFLLRKNVEDLKDKMPQDFAENFAFAVPKSEKTLVLDPNVALVPELNVADCEGRWKDPDGIQLEGKGDISAMEEDDRQLLLEAYKKMYPSLAGQLSLANVPNVFMLHSVVKVGPMLYAGMRSRRKDRLSWIMAKWYESTDGMKELRPCQIQYFMKHNLRSAESGEMSEHVFAVVRWHLPVMERTNFISPITMWKSQRFEVRNWSTFLPVVRITGRFGGCTTEDGHNLIIASVPRPVYL